LTAEGSRFARATRQEQRHILQNAHRRMTSGHVKQWTETLNQISEALAEAGHTFENLCLQCGAYADGTCVLDGGKAACKFEATSPARRQPHKPKASAVIGDKASKSGAGPGSGSRKRR
jgi:hypothetical protein